MSVLGDRIRMLRKQQGLRQDDLSARLNDEFGLNTDRVMISKWETGFQTPVMNTIICLSKFFNVSIDYLNGNGEDNEMQLSPSTDEISEQVKKLHSIIDSLPPERRDEAERYLTFLLGTQDK